MTRSKGVNSFGPVAHMIGAVFTGIFLASCITVLNRTNFEATNIMLMMITNTALRANLTCVAAVSPVIEHTMMIIFFDFASSVELTTHNTYKRCGSSPFKFGETKYKTSLEQIDISENGPKTVPWAQKKPRVTGGPPMNLVLYRNGTGRCVMLASTKPGMDGLH